MCASFHNDNRSNDSTPIKDVCLLSGTCMQFDLLVTTNFVVLYVLGGPLYNLCPQNVQNSLQQKDFKCQKLV